MILLILQRFTQSEIFRGGESLSCEQHMAAFRRLEPLRDRSSVLFYVYLIIGFRESLKSDISEWGSKAMSCDL